MEDPIELFKKGYSLKQVVGGFEKAVLQRLIEKYGTDKEGFRAIALECLITNNGVRKKMIKYDLLKPLTRRKSYEDYAQMMSKVTSGNPKT